MATGCDLAVAGRWPLDCLVQRGLDLGRGSGAVAQGSFGPSGSASLTFSTASVDPAKTYALSVAAVGANGSTTPAASATVRFAVPALTTVTTSPTQVQAAWTAPPGAAVSGYELSLQDTSTSPPVALGVLWTAATSGGIDLAALGLQPGVTSAWALQVRVAEGSALGPPSALTALVTSSPRTGERLPIPSPGSPPRRGRPRRSPTPAIRSRCMPADCLRARPCRRRRRAIDSRVRSRRDPTSPSPWRR